MKKKVAFLIMNMDKKGGTERVTSMISNSLSQKFDVHIFSCQNGKTPYFHVNKNVQVESLHGERIKNSILRKIYVFNNLYNLVKKNNIDVVIAVDVALFLYLLPLKVLNICKCISWEHFNYFINPTKTVELGRKLSAKYADKLIVLGKNDQKNYEKHFPNIKNIQYIYNPVSVSVSTEIIDNKSKRIMAAGRLENQKGFDKLIDIWSLVESEFPEWRLDIFGEGSQREKLQNKIDKLGLRKISLAGYADDISKELEKSSIFLLTSRYEGFGLVLIEAQAKGVPCISFDCSEGPSEIINNGVNGYLIENNDIVGFAEKLKTLIKNNKKIKEFSKHSRDNIDRFNIEKISLEWEKVLEGV